MRCVPVLALLALPLLLLAGCLQSRDALVLNKDGSGTITSQYVVELGRLRELMQMWEMMQGGDPEAAGKIKDEDLPNPAAPAWFEAAAEGSEGYALEKAVQETLDGKRSTQISARFTSLEAAAKAGAFFTSTVTLSAVEKSEQVPAGGWKLVIKNALSGGNSEAMQGMDLATAMSTVEAQLASLSIDLSIVVPTKILDHNGAKAKDAERVSWKVDYDKILEGKDLTMWITFEAAEGLALKPFTYAPDMRMLAKRAMSKAPPRKGSAQSAKEKDAKSGSAKDAKEKDAKSAKGDDPKGEKSGKSSKSEADDDR